MSAGATPRASDARTADRSDELAALVPDLLRYFIRRLDDREDAADAVSETLVLLWRKERALPEDAEDRRSYAFGIARNVVRSSRRSRLRRRALADRLREQVHAALTSMSDAPVDLGLRAALATLSDADRELVLLVAWEGFGVAEAGAMLGLRPDAARARYSRARARLRAALE